MAVGPSVGRGDGVTVMVGVGAGLATLLVNSLTGMGMIPVVGASGGIAFALAGNAPGDGHTLLVSSVSITIVETTLAKSLGATDGVNASDSG